MKSMRFHDSKLKFMNAWLFSSFHDSEAPAVFYCFAFVSGGGVLCLGKEDRLGINDLVLLFECI